MTNSETSYTRDPRKAKQFATRKEATAAALAIRWTRADVHEIDVMGFRLWAVADAHLRMLTVPGYALLLSAVEAEYARRA